MPTEPSEPLSVETTITGRAVVVTLSGSADIDQMDVLAPKLWDAAHAADELLILVMRELSFVCSEGLGALLKARIICQDKDVSIALVDVATPVLQVLQTTRLTKVMPIFDSVDAALADA